MALIRRNIPVGRDYYLMDLIAPDVALDGSPGQFVHVKISSERNYDPLLRRPFSIHDINPHKGLVSLVYRVTGKGTEIMSDLKENRDINLLGPLGNGFRTDFDGKNILIIGGGMGIAPLYYLAKKLLLNNDITVLLGGNCEEDLMYFNNVFNQLSLHKKLATMDGSKGYQGTVIDLWQDLQNDKKADFDFIYSCGPEIMLRRVQEIAREQNISGQLSLEKRMGCGIGVCLSCVCKTIHGNQRVCHEGPVFSLAEVILND